MILECFPTPDMGENVYLLADGAGNCLLVDPGDPASPAFARAAELGQVRYILLTHGHFDHILGVHECRRRTGGALVIHADEVSLLRDTGANLMDRFFPGGGWIPPEPDLAVREGDELPFGDTVIRVLHTPGHTPGGACYRVGDRLFTGDTLFCGSMGRVDFPGGSQEELFGSLRRLAALEEDLAVLPGHGPATTLFRERDTNPYVKRACYGTVCDR